MTSALDYYIGASVFMDASKSMNIIGQAGLKQVRDCEKGLQILSRMYIPGIVMQAFAAELLFKAIIVNEGKQIRKTHKLNKLFAMLSSSERKIISSNIISDIRNNKNYYGYGESELNRDIDKIANTFEDWRYFFEKNDVSVDEGFLDILVVVLYDRCKILLE